ncbi:MAG: site-2 protease family protein [Clostridia bacterium]|nr:site-2 protease family protein [Clostridia bacterium]
MLISLLSSNAPVWQIVSVLVAYISALLMALSMHEYAHAFVAYKNGDSTAKAQGRLTIKPFSHLDPIGSVCLVLFGYGWAKPVPVDSRNFGKPRRAGFLVAIAGVSMNVILAIVWALIYALLIAVFPQVLTNTGIYGIMLNYFLYYSVAINLVLAFFNILPVYPLDGFRVVETFSKPDNSYVMFMRVFGAYIMLGLILFGVIGLYVQIPLSIADWLVNALCGLFVG